MKIVLFSRVPRWYSFKNERLASHLAAEGFEILGVIVEEVPTVTALREWTKKLGFGVFVKKVAQRLTGKGNVSSDAQQNSEMQLSKVAVSPEVFHFNSHNSSECIAKVKELGPEVIVLRGCGIIKNEMLKVPKVGVINPHYALLPDFRGMDVTEWSALHGDPIAVSVHSVNKGVDTGTVLKSETIEPTSEDTVGSLRDKSATLAVKLLKDALVDLRDGKEFPENQMNDGGRQFFKMHPRLKELANERLQAFSGEKKSSSSIETERSALGNEIAT